MIIQTRTRSTTLLAVTNRCLLLLIVLWGHECYAAIPVISDLANTPGADNQTQIVLGYDASGDGGGGVFEYRSNQPDLQTDGGTIFDGLNGGKWLRVYSGALEAAWFGAHPVKGKRCLIQVNGGDVGYVGFPATGDWNSWKKESIQISLQAGENQIRIESNARVKGPTLKNLALGKIDIDAREVSSESGCSVQGDGVALGGWGTYVQWDSITVPSAGIYMLTITYANGDVASLEEVRVNTQRLQWALDAAADKGLLIGKGVYQISDTLIIPENTRVEGRVPHFEDLLHRGTVLECFGEGTVRKWQDTGDPSKDKLRPMVVFGGNNIYLTQIGMIPGNHRWEVGVLLPTVKGCVLDNCEIIDFGLAACLMDATWSKKNEAMIRLHGGKIKPAEGLSQCNIYCCKLKGQWGLMVRGAENRNPADYTDKTWLWAPEGCSDLKVSASRIQSLGQTGGAYYHDVPARNREGSGEGHRFISCRLHMNSQYMIKINHTHNLNLTGCYLEGWGHETKSLMINDAEHTGTVEFFALKFVDSNWDKWTWSNTKRWP